MASRRRYKKDNRAGKMAIFCIVAVLLVVMSMQIRKLYIKNQEYIAQEANLMNQLEDETERRDDLAQQENEMQSQQYQESLARRIFNLVYDDEIIFREKK